MSSITKFTCFNAKQCKKCKEFKCYSEFSRRFLKTGQVHEQCRSCKALYRLNKIATTPGMAELLREKSKKQSKEYLRKWRRKNKKLATFYTTKYLASKKKRTPSWADLDAIELFYLNCPDGYEVDHIIPLQGKFVSGLHVLENLQYLTKKENRSKGNSFNGVTL